MNIHTPTELYATSITPHRKIYLELPTSTYICISLDILRCMTTYNCSTEWLVEDTRLHSHLRPSDFASELSSITCRLDSRSTVIAHWTADQ